MSRGVRLAVCLGGLALLAVALLAAIGDLSPFGQRIASYGDVLAHSADDDRHAPNSVIVTAFDYRGMDTVVEELILFVSATSIAVLLRASRSDDERETARRAADQEEATTSESLRWIGTGLVGPVALLAAYIVTHGTLSPGGGFQGGVILLAALILPLLIGRFELATRVRGMRWVEVVEALGAAGFVALGFGGLIASGAFLENFLGDGPAGLLDSGGFIMPANIAVALEVAGALLIIASELVDVRFLAHAEDPR